MADTWLNLANAVVGNPIPAATINTILANLRVLGGNGVTAPTSDIEALKALVDALVAPTNQAGVPSSTPTVIGQLNVDTTANRLYVATGTGSSADWDKQPVYRYGVGTLTGGGGDVTETLDIDWSGGTIIVMISPTAADFYSNGSSTPSVYITTYDALVNVEYTYTDLQILGMYASGIAIHIKSFNRGGIPKSATTTSFTLDDDGNTRYYKYIVIA